MDCDFLLETATARHLYHDYAEALPLIDYHCHISPRDIYENRRFNDLAEVWLGGRQPDGSYFGDHYKWRLMRSNGVDEDYISGDKPGFERFERFVGALELAAGNPLYHWCHLELRKYFGFEGHLCADNAAEVWALCNQKLHDDPKLGVRGLIERSNVAMIGTTDDPIDSLEWHKKIAADSSIGFAVCPSFRPDKAINLTKPGFADYIVRLAQSVGKTTLSSAREVCDALVERLEFFKELGCRACDHGLDYVMCRPGTPEQADAAFLKALAGQPLTIEEAEIYQTQLLLCLGRAYHRLDIAMQLHYNCLRNPNSRMLEAMGPDTGFDVMGDRCCAQGILDLLDALEQTGELPKTILYSLNPNENALLDTLLGAFQGVEVPGKIQHGSAWWFNDTRSGMEEQLRSLASLSLLGNFVGMLTDSRSFLSYTRFEYFRRIFCNLLGGWVERGEYPADEKALRRLVEGVCCQNARRYFGL